MNAARIVVLTIAVGAGGVAGCLASASDSKPPPADPVAQLQTADVLVAKSDIGLGQTVMPDDMQWPAAASSSSIRRKERPDATAPDDQSAQRGNINVVRYGDANPTTIQK